MSTDAPSNLDQKPVAVIGGGPAGLTAAYWVTGRGRPAVVFEADTQVGGIARTVVYKGFRFDIGGHRFFTKVKAVNELWDQVLGPEMLRRPRLSRIYYNGKYFDYPLKAMNALFGLGIINAIQIMASYVWVRIKPIAPEVSVEDWVSNRFGRRLYQIFFKTYTEKVWGVPCSELGAQWAAQRIKGLSLRVAVTNALFGRFNRDKTKVKTLIEEFKYPRLGPGMMWEAFQKELESRGCPVELESRVKQVSHDGKRITSIEIERHGVTRTLDVSAVISTMPLRTLVRALSPAAPPQVLDAANRLRYRDYFTVALVINQENMFPDNWIYVHDPKVKLGRIQNFKNWSPAMVPDQRQTCLGLEYFCFEGDGLWNLSDAELVELGKRELAAIGLADPATIVDGTVVRQPKAYPIYDEGFVQALDVVREYLLTFENLQVAGRNGMHKYNNQDHSMVTAILAARNLLGADHNVWAVNADEDYHEEDHLQADDFEVNLQELASSQPWVPEAVRKSS
jgi:protoporphyrinogen oxidase